MLDIIMKVAAANANKQFSALEPIVLNIANINTMGYKAKRFDQYLTSDDRLEGVTRVDASQGDRLMTRRELDIAVEGAGYIPVTQPDGRVAYTRDGSFTMDSKGYLVTPKGDLVGNGIQIPSDYHKIAIKENGQILVQTSKRGPFNPIGKLSLVRFANPEGLTNLGNNKLQPSAKSGEPQADDTSQIYQGMLERANINVYGQIEQTLRLNAAAISNMRIIKFADDLYRQSISLRQ